MGHGKCHLQASLHFQADFDASDEEALPIAVAKKAAEGEPDEPGEPEAAAKEGEAKSASETNEASYSFAVADISRSNLCIFEVLTTFLTCVLFQGSLTGEGTVKVRTIAHASDVSCNLELQSWLKCRAIRVW